MEIKTQRREYLKLRHSRILQGINTKILFSTALLASVLLLYNLLRFDILLLIAPILVICCLTYSIYQFDSRKLIKMEQELGDSKEDRLGVLDRIVLVSITIISLALLVLIFVFVLLLIH